MITELNETHNSFTSFYNQVFHQPVNRYQSPSLSHSHWSLTLLLVKEELMESVDFPKTVRVSLLEGEDNRLIYFLMSSIIE